MKKVNLAWSISLLVISVSTIILAGANIVDVELADTTVRVLGVFDLMALPILVFTSVKKMRTKG